MHNHKPLIKRSRYFDHFPQLPDWFCTYDRIAARDSFLKKFKSQYKLEIVSQCALCNSKQQRLIATQERHGLPISVVICMDCGLLYNTPRLDFDSIADHYATDARAIERGTDPSVHGYLFESQTLKGNAILNLLNSPEVKTKLGRDIRRVLEVGCGEGGALKVFKSRGYEVMGFELNPRAVEYGQKVHGLEILCSSINSSHQKIDCDLIIYEQVLEHILNPNSELEALAQAQNDGSLLYVGVPGLLEFPKHYNGNLLAYLEYQHVLHFSLGTLERLLAKHGYQLIYGNETIQALFEKKSESSPINILTPLKPPQEIVAFLMETEKEYQKGPKVTLRSHLRYLKKHLLFKIGAGSKQK